MNIAKNLIRIHMNFKQWLILIIFSIVFDHSLPYIEIKRIYVNLDFISNLYTAIFTIAAFSGTVLSIILSSFENKYYGFTVKEILNFKESEHNLSDLTPLSLSIAIIATILLVFEYINTLFILFLYLVYVIIKYIDYVWSISSKDEFCRDLVRKEIKRIIADSDELDYLKLVREKLFNHYSNTLGLYDTNERIKIIDLIISTLNKQDLEDSNLRKKLDGQISHIFFESIPVLGYTTAISEVLSIYDKANIAYFDFDKIKTMLKPLIRIQFYNQERLSTSGFINIYKDLEFLNSLSRNEKVSIMYTYFKSIILNEEISTTYKAILINVFIKNVMRFNTKEVNNFDIVKKTVILKIHKDFILLNSDEEIRNAIFVSIIDACRENRFSENPEYYNTIALILISIYFYSFKEISTIEETHREELKSLITLKPINIKKAKLTFIEILSRDIREVVRAIINIALDSENEYHQFEYFPYSLVAKTIVLTKEAVLSLGFKLYLIYYYDIFNSPIILIKDLSNMDIINKLDVLNVFMDFFDDGTSNLTKDAINDLTEIASWLELKTNSYNFKKVHDMINEELKKINKEYIENVKPVEENIINMEDLSESLNKYLVEKNFFGYDRTISLEKSEELTFNPLIEAAGRDKNIIYRVEMGIRNVLSSIVKEILPIETLSFDMDGIQKLLELLSAKTLNSRNYTFIDDLAFSKQVRTSPQFKELEEIIYKMEMKNTEPIRNYMFFNSEDFKFNVEISKYKSRELTPDELGAYTENFKVSEEYYKIKGALYDKSNSMEIVGKMYKVYEVSIRIKSLITPESGFAVDFDYKRRGSSE